MSSEATNENLQIVLSKLMTDRYCSGEASDFDACIQNYVPHRSDHSHIEEYYHRKGMKQCEPYRDVLRRCMQDEKKQQVIFRQASAVPQCKAERNKLLQCQRQKGRDCEQEALETVYCGMIYLVQKRQQKIQQADAA